MAIPQKSDMPNQVEAAPNDSSSMQLDPRQEATGNAARPTSRGAATSDGIFSTSSSDWLSKVGGAKFLRWPGGLGEMPTKANAIHTKASAIEADFHGDARCLQQR